MTVREVYEQLTRLVDDGNDNLELMATMDGSGVALPIVYIEVYDDPPYIVLGESIYRKAF